MYFNALFLLPLLALTHASPLKSQKVYNTTFGGVPASNTCDGYVAFNQTLSTAAGCVPLSVSSYLVGQQPHRDCTFTLYNGYGCAADSVIGTTAIPKGSGSVCAYAGVVGSIIAIIQLTGTVVQYVRDVKDALKYRDRLLIELVSLCGCLQFLKDTADRAESEPGGQWMITIRLLDGPNGPLSQFKLALETLARHLKPEVGWRKHAKVLVWPFKEEEVRDILSTIERQKSLFNLAVQNDHAGLSEAIHTKIDQLKAYQEKRDEDVETTKILSWLSPLNFWTVQQDIFGRRQEGTGTWLLDDDIFQSWLHGTERVLWCPGDPGAGKTILASTVVDYLEQKFTQTDVGIAYIYFNYKEQEQTFINLISSLLRQLIQPESKIPNNIIDLHRSHINKGTRPLLAEYSELLQSKVMALSTVFIIVDALDECDKGETRVDFLAELRNLLPHIRLLVTSRYLVSIERSFENDARLEIRANNGDVEKYVRARIQKEPRLLQHVKADPALEEQIITTIIEKARGMFVSSKLTLVQIMSAKKRNRREVRTALHDLPEELNHTYDETMKRIESQDPGDFELAKRVLSWISFAFRPLTVKEIKHALAVQPTDTYMDEEGLSDEELLVSVCAGIVTIDEQSDIIRLVHYTTQEYFELERTRARYFPTAHADIAKTCLTYLSFTTFADGSCSDLYELTDRCKTYPFLEYAAAKWGHHAHASSETTVLPEIIKFLVQSSNASFSSQMKLLESESRESNPVSDLKYQRRCNYVTPGLCIAASFDLKETVKTLLDEGADIGANDSEGLTALHWAAVYGCGSVLELLLEDGTNIEAETISPRKARLGYGISKEMDNPYWEAFKRHPLHFAVQFSTKEIVKLLLERGADIKAKDAEEWTVLHFAARRDDDALVQLLLDNGADVEARNKKGGTPLFTAAVRWGKGVVQILLDNGVDVEARNEDGETPLYVAAKEGCDEVVRLLLKNGADIEARNKYGETPLCVAAKWGRDDAVQLLLKNGAEIEARVINGGTPLYAAAESGEDAVVRLLLKNGADIAARNERGETPLFLAASGWRSDGVVRIFLDNGADIEARNNDGETPLYAAAERGHYNIVQLLLKNGADIGARNNAGQTPLHAGAAGAVATEHNDDVVRVLLENGANVEVRDKYGETPLFAAAEWGHYSIVQLLLKNGADIEARNNAGQTTLFAAAALEWAKDVVQILLDNGADIEARNNDGETPLYAAAREGCDEVVQLLLDKGATKDLDITEIRQKELERISESRKHRTRLNTSSIPETLKA
ncbi:MAG: hypothetical protein Q9187_004635 [Circinaria calcarea]